MTNLQNVLWILLWIIVGIIALAAAVVILWAITLFIYDLTIDPKKEYDEHKIARVLTNFSCWLILRMCRVRIITEGMEKVPEGGALFVCNHRSNVDPLIMVRVFRKKLPCLISKASNFKIPAVGPLIRKCCFMEIDREDPRKAMVTINKAAGLLSDGMHSVGVYPEGTRNKNAGAMIDIHAGVFKIAQKAQKPIVICSVRGTENVGGRAPWRTTKVYFHIVDVMEAEDIKRMKTSLIAEHMKEVVEKDLDQYEHFLTKEA